MFSYGVILLEIITLERQERGRYCNPRSDLTLHQLQECCWSYRLTCIVLYAMLCLGGELELLCSSWKMLCTTDVHFWQLAFDQGIS